MVKYSTVILLFAVAVFWSSVTARSGHEHYEERHHRIAIENDIQKFLQYALKVADEVFKDSNERITLTNILLEAKHKRWSSFEELSTYLFPALRAIKAETSDEDSRRKRSFDSDSVETSEFEEFNVDQLAKLIYLNLLIGVAPPDHQTDLFQKFEEVTNKKFGSVYDFTNEAHRIFKEVTGDDIEKYTDQLAAGTRY